MKQWPNNLKNLITYFGRLPGIGPKMAERVVLHLLSFSPEQLQQFASLINNLRASNIYCSECHTLSEEPLCSICRDPRRNATALLVTADPVSALNIEASGKYNGKYFILGGLLNPIEGITPEKIRLPELITHLKEKPTVQEIILAFNANVEGEATLIYLTKLLTPFKNIKLTRLARGLPMGSDLTYADEVTLSAALEERQTINK